MTDSSVEPKRCESPNCEYTNSAAYAIVSVPNRRPLTLCRACFVPYRDRVERGENIEIERL